MKGRAIEGIGAGPVAVAYNQPLQLRLVSCIQGLYREQIRSCGNSIRVSGIPAPAGMTHGKVHL
jgi:hypothetical protein